MELGEKIRQARLAAGLSQRQLCGEEITRNMLSQIEHGTARPSMGTLQYLASRLQKPISYFLEEDAPEPSENSVPGRLHQAEQALAQGKHLYAKALLEQVDTDFPALVRWKLLLLSRLPDAQPEHLVPSLPSLEEELLLRAQAALQAEQFVRCRKLLDAMEDPEALACRFLQGQLAYAQAQFSQAAAWFHRCEAELPTETAPYLEQCYRAMEDYRQAYFYACKQK